MEENDVLDDLEDLQPELPEHRQRCFRFFWYSLGIGLVMSGQIWLGSSVDEAGGLPYDSGRLNYLVSLGVIGIWLFAGLGSLAGIRAVKQGRSDLLLVGVLTIHLVSFVLSTSFLYN